MGVKPWLIGKLSASGSVGQSINQELTRSIHQANQHEGHFLLIPALLKSPRQKRLLVGRKAFPAGA
ncbi:MAG: hypothetical protein KDA57_16925, partial [Planctomycetales bacterium]|nr:hypothetical protein [Planctomycetales bacterium]